MRLWPRAFADQAVRLAVAQWCSDLSRNWQPCTRSRNHIFRSALARLTARAENLCSVSSSFAEKAGEAGAAEIVSCSGQCIPNGHFDNTGQRTQDEVVRPICRKRAPSAALLCFVDMPRHRRPQLGLGCIRSAEAAETITSCAVAHGGHPLCRSQVVGRRHQTSPADLASTLISGELAFWPAVGKVGGGVHPSANTAG